MRKSFVILGLIVMLYSSCSLFKERTKNVEIDKTETKIDLEVKKEELNVKLSETKGISEKENSVSSEEIVYKKSNPEPIELTATFRIDTSSTFKGDTALKLVDINNSNISVAIYQNKKTNEIMAKVKTGGKVQNVPFEELRINKTYTVNKEKIDTSKKDSSVVSLSLDSVNKGKVVEVKKTKDTETKLSSNSVWAMIGVVGVICIVLLIGWYLKHKTKLP